MARLLFTFGHRGPSNLYGPSGYYFPASADEFAKLCKYIQTHFDRRGGDVQVARAGTDAAYILYTPGGKKYGGITEGIPLSAGIGLLEVAVQCLQTWVAIAP